MDARGPSGEPDPVSAGASDVPPAGSIPPWLPSAIRTVIGYVLATLAALWLLGAASDLVRWLLLATFFSLALEPGVNRLVARGWSRGKATSLLLFGGLGFFLVLGITLIPVVVENVGQIADEIPGWIDELNDYTEREFGGALIPEETKGPSTATIESLRDFIADYGGELIGVIGGVVGAIFALFTIALFTFYMTTNAPRIRRSVVALLRPERQRRALWAWNIAIEKTGAYLYQRLMLAVVNSTGMLLVLLAVDIPFPIPLALFTGFTAAFIPIVGSYLAGSVPVLVALATGGLGRGLIILAWIVIYQQIENYVLEPRLSKKTMDLNPGIALGAAIAGASVGGLIGAFFALPTAAAIQAFIGEYAPHYAVEEEALARVERPDRKESPDAATEPTTEVDDA